MSQGKYSPRVPHAGQDYDYRFDCRGQEPVPYDHLKDVYDPEIHFGDYDDEGFDRYGYSAFDSDGQYVGLAGGVDRLGHTEWDYLAMSEDDFLDIAHRG